MNKFYLYGEINEESYIAVKEFWKFYSSKNKLNKKCLIIIDSEGGYTYWTEKILTFLKSYYKIIIAHIKYHCKSAAAWLALNCDKIIDYKKKGLLVHSLRDVWSYYYESKNGVQTNYDFWSKTKFNIPLKVLSKICCSGEDIIISIQNEI